MTTFHPDKLIAKFNKAVILTNKNGENVGVFIDIDTWRDIDRIIDTIPDPESKPRLVWKPATERWDAVDHAFEVPHSRMTLPAATDGNGYPSRCPR